VSVTRTPGQHHLNVSISALGKKKEQIFVVLMDIVQLVPLTLAKFKFTQLFKLTNVTMSMEQRVLHILAVADLMEACFCHLIKKI